MANIKAAYGGATGITITVASLANNAARQSTAVDNTSNLYLDAELNLLLEMNTSSAVSGNVYIAIAGSVDGTNYDLPATGSDAAITIPQLGYAVLGSLQPGQQIPGTSLTFAGTMQCFAQATSAVVNWTLKSVAALLGGNLPPKWSIVVINMTGQTLAASGHTTQYNGVYATSV